MKRPVIMALVLVASLSIVGCSNMAVTTPDGTETTTICRVSIWTDQETGVEYVIAKVNRGVGICPRYNPDGSLVVDE